MSGPRTDRHLAIVEGRGKYTGSPCKKCSNLVRYTTSGSCVVCNDARVKARSKSLTKSDQLLRMILDAPTDAEIAKAISFARRYVKTKESEL